MRRVVTAGLASALFGSFLVLGAGVTASSAQTTWSAVAGASLSDYEAGLNGVSCPTSTFCVAVGNQVVSSGDDYGTLAETWNGTAWSVSATAVPSDSEYPQFNSVSCPSATFCVAVGTYYNTSGAGEQDTLIETFNGTSWSVVSSSNQYTGDTSANNELDGVSCASATFCVVVGYAGNGAASSYVTLAETWNGTSWSLSSTPSLTTTSPVLTSVSCVNATFCEAVGRYAGDGGTIGETFNGSSWSVSGTVDPATGVGALEGVSCASATFCEAVGDYEATASNYSMMAETYNGSTWTSTSPVNPLPLTGNNENYLDDISCPTTTTCEAAGFVVSSTTGDFETAIEDYASGTWDVASSPDATGEVDTEFGGYDASALAFPGDGIACGNGAPCFAVGEADNGSGADETFIAEGPVYASGPAPTSFSIAVNGSTSATVSYGTSATLAESGIPTGATGTVVFSSAGDSDLCTITLPATSCPTSTTLPAASYSPISATFTDTDGNYAGSTSTNTVALTVSPAASSFSITVDGSASATITYGTSAILAESGIPTGATGTVVFSSAGDSDLCTITLPATSCPTSTTLPAASYFPISAAFTDTDGNYAGSTSTNTVSLTVNPPSTTLPVLTITASSASITYGSAPPVITPSYSGFVNGDTTSSLTRQPICYADVAYGAPVSGSPYPSICFGAADPNYTIVYVEGTVTVTPAPTSFSITVNGTDSATMASGTSTSSAVLAESGLPEYPRYQQVGSASGTVTFTYASRLPGLGLHAPALCTITLPATSCDTSATLPVGSYKNITGTFADTDGNYLGSTSTNTVSLTVEPPITTYVTNCNDSGPGSLRYVVTHAVWGQTVGFDLPRSGSPGYCNVITLTSGSITLDTNLIINGPGANTLAVSGDNASTVFVVDSGVIAKVNGLTVEDSSGSGYEDLGLGGGIYNDGALTLTDSTLSNNKNDAGGGIYNGGTLTLTDSTLSDNSSITCGGGIDNGGTLTLTDSTLSDNTADDGVGGAICSNGPATVTDSTLSGNSAQEVGAGGGIENSRAGTLTLTDSTLSDNTAPLGNGGGIDNDGTLTLTSSTLSGNSSDGTGGGIDNDGTLTLTSSTLSDNHSTGGSGGGIYNSSLLAATATVTDSTLSDNTAAGYGGGIDNEYTAIVTDSTLSGNGSAQGGGAIINNFTATITDSTLSGNTADGGPPQGLLGGASGGGIDNNASMTVSESTLSENTAPFGNGGGIFNDSESPVTVTDSTLSDNSAEYGGGISFWGTLATVTHVTLSENTASAASGGGIYSNGGSTVLTASIVAGSGSGLDCVGGVTDGGYNLDDDGSCGLSTANGSLSDTPADFVSTTPRGNGGSTLTIALQPGSEAIDRVTSASDCTGADQRGVPWPTPCDVGAIQAGFITSTTVSLPSVHVVGVPLTATAVVSPGASRFIVALTGTVTFTATLNGSAYALPAICSNVPLSSDEARCTFTPSSAGTYSVTAVYSGDATYGDSLGSAPVDVVGFPVPIPRL